MMVLDCIECCWNCSSRWLGYKSLVGKTWVCQIDRPPLPIKTPLIHYTVVVNDDFILHLLRLTEQLSDDADDPYHYPIIRVLVRSHFASPCTGIS